VVSESYARIYAVVRRIPRGRVATYGQVARLAGLPHGARQVGYALHALSGAGDVPWHRVVAAPGRIAPRADPDGARWQRELLTAEGVTVDGKGGISLARFRWRPRVRPGA